MNTQTLEDLIAKVRREAERLDFPVDLPVYERSGRDPKQPILCAGNLGAPVCIVGRDLGKDEVKAGQPLIGQAGRKVRDGIVAATQKNPNAARPATVLDQALEHALLTNIVPYKPPGNKAYPESIRKRFRPFLEALLTHHWTGHHLITLGSECFAWFERYMIDDSRTIDLATSERFERSFRCRLPLDPTTPGPAKELTLYPLPHPSPLNRRWFAMFPSLLASRLSEIGRAGRSGG